MKFLENGTRPQPPTSPRHIKEGNYITNSLGPSIRIGRSTRHFARARNQHETARTHNYTNTQIHTNIRVGRQQPSICTCVQTAQNCTHTCTHAHTNTPEHQSRTSAPSFRTCVQSARNQTHTHTLSLTHTHRNTYGSTWQHNTQAMRMKQGGGSVTHPHSPTHTHNIIIHTWKLYVEIQGNPSRSSSELHVSPLSLFLSLALALSAPASVSVSVSVAVSVSLSRARAVSFSHLSLRLRASNLYFYVCWYLRFYLCMWSYLCLRVCICVYMCVHIYIHTNVYTHIYRKVSLQLRGKQRTHAKTHEYIHICCVCKFFCEHSTCQRKEYATTHTLSHISSSFSSWITRVGCKENSHTYIFVYTHD